VRERVEALRAAALAGRREAETDLAAAVDAHKASATIGGMAASLVRFQERVWMCDLADILLDAIEAR
jgi:hypothetical protein